MLFEFGSALIIVPNRLFESFMELVFDHADRVEGSSWFIDEYSNMEMLFSAVTLFVLNAALFIGYYAKPESHGGNVAACAV